MLSVCMFLGANSLLTAAETVLINNFISKKTYDIVIFVDAGAQAVLKHQISARKAFLIGDFDSIDSHRISDIELKITQQFNNFSKITLPQNKNISDFGAALNLLDSVADSDLAIDIFYGLGGRLDHENINCQEIVTFISKRKAKTTCFFYSQLLIAQNEIILPIEHNQVFSVWSACGIYPCTVKITGALYSGTQILERPSHGLSNVAASDVVTCNPINSDIICVSWNN